MSVLSPTAPVRDIAVSAGASELVWTQITELNGLDISIDVYQLALVPYGYVPSASDFQDVDETEVVSQDVVKVALLVDSGTAGKYRLWAKVTDTQEVSIFPASGTVEIS